MPTLINTERTGSGETQYFDDGTSKFIQRPVGFFGDETPETPATIDRTTVTRDVPDVLSPTDFAASEEARAETIRLEQTEEARARVAGIEQRFEGIVSQEETAGEGRLGSTRARGARGGLLGSSFGASQKAGTEEFNLQQQQFIQQQQEQEILAVYDLFDERASKRIEEERALSFATREEKIANRDAMIADSRTDFSMLGQSGQFPTLDLLSEEDIAEWSAQTGYSKEMLKLINSENQPAETKIDWQEEIIGNTYLRTGYNPVTGKMEVIKIDLPADSDGLQIIDGVPYNKVLNEDGTITLRKAEGFEEEQPSELEIEKETVEIEKIRASIAKTYDDIASSTTGIDREIKQAQLDKLNQDLSKKSADEDKAKIAVGQANGVLQDKISLINGLLAENSGLNTVVGTFALGRIPTFSALTGKSQEFVGGVKQLISKETIDTLVSLKARGGTLGALSDQERVLLQNAATKIGSWEKKDKNGYGTGRFNVSESVFRKELESIKALAEKAIKKVGEPISETTGDTDFDSVWD